MELTGADAPVSSILFSRQAAAGGAFENLEKKVASS